MIRTKHISKIIAIILLVSMILRFCFVLIHLNHECNHEDDCPICQLIHKFKEDLSTYNPNLLEAVISVIIFFDLIINYLKKIYYDKQKQTLIGLKVELLN